MPGKHVHFSSSVDYTGYPPPVSPRLRTVSFTDIDPLYSATTSTEPQSHTFDSESASTFATSGTYRGRSDAGGPRAASPGPQPQPRGGSMFSNAQNTVIHDGHFVACESAEITIHSTCTAHRDSSGLHTPSSAPASVLLVFPATLWTAQAPARLPSIQMEPPPPFEVALRYRAPLPIYYEDLPVLFAPLFFVYLWRFVFGYHSLASNV